MIGVVLPSRGRPKECENACRSLQAQANGPVDIIVRLDADDPTLLDYKLRDLAVVVVGQRGRGYLDNHRMIDEAARFVRGDLIMQFVDDAEMRTLNWDDEYRRAAGNREIFVCAANVLCPSGKSMEWSFPVIPRKLMEINGGRFCLGDNSSVDRCWAAFARHHRCGVMAPVTIFHKIIGGCVPDDQTSREGRTPFTLSIRDRASWGAEHDRIGREFSDQVRHALQSR